MNTKNPNLNTKKFDSFADSLSYLLENRGLKQAYLVEKAQKGADEISRYVTGKVVPRVKTQKILGDVLGVTFKQDAQGKWMIDSHVDQARDEVSQVEEELSAYKASGLRSDDPEKLLEFAEMLIRTARELMKLK